MLSLPTYIGSAKKREIVNQMLPFGTNHRWRGNYSNEQSIDSPRYLTVMMSFVKELGKKVTIVFLITFNVCHFVFVLFCLFDFRLILDYRRSHACNCISHL